MSRFANDPFPGTDYTKYLEWPKVTAPNGAVYYEVPGHPEYVMDITASNASGRKVFRANPKGAIKEQADAEALQKKQVDQQLFNGSPLGQVIPVGGTVLGLAAANGSLFGDGGSSAATTAEALLKKQAAEELLKQQAVNQGLGASAAGGFTGPPLPTLANGGLTGPVAPEALGGFDVAGIGSAGNYILPAAGALGAYDVFAHDVSPVRGTLEGAASGAAIGSYGGPPGAIIGGVIGGGLGLAKSLFGQHESTRDVAKKHTSSLLKSSDDPTYQSYVGAMRQGFDTGPSDPSKPFAGKYSNFEEYKKAGLDPNDLSGVYGNLKLGPQYANLDQTQKAAFTQTQIAKGNYHSKKGEVDFVDPSTAQSDFQAFLQGLTTAQPKTLGQAAAASNAKPLVIQNQVTPEQAKQAAPFIRR